MPSHYQFLHPCINSSCNYIHQLNLIKDEGRCTTLLFYSSSLVQFSFSFGMSSISLWILTCSPLQELLSKRSLFMTFQFSTLKKSLVPPEVSNQCYYFELVFFVLKEFFVQYDLKNHKISDLISLPFTAQVEELGFYNHNALSLFTCNKILQSGLSFFKTRTLVQGHTFFNTNFINLCTNLAYNHHHTTTKTYSILIAPNIRKGSLESRLCCLKEKSSVGCNPNGWRNHRGLEN